MTESELLALFADTAGNITIREQSGPASAKSCDLPMLANLIEVFDIPMIDLVTDQGEAVGLVTRQPLSAHQSPMPTVWGGCGDVFLGNGVPLPGQQQGVHMAASWQLHNLHPERHCLKGLQVKFESIEKQESVGVWPEHPCLNDRTAEEGKQLLSFNDRCALVFIGSKQYFAWSRSKGGPVKFISVRDFQQREAIRLVEVKTKGGEIKTLKMADEWLRWLAHRRQAIGACFASIFKMSFAGAIIYNLLGL